MNLQYISDSTGKTTGVFIPIEDWKNLQKQLKNIAMEEEIPPWHKSVVMERMEEYKNNSGSALDFDGAIDQIEDEL